MKQAFDIIFNRDRGVYQQVFVDYDVETGEAKLNKVVDLSSEKHKVVFDVQKYMANKLLKLNNGVD